MNNVYLEHHGVKGQKWGIRRYQRKDGSLTVMGKVRYRTDKEFKTNVNRQRAAEKARQARLAKKQHESDKERVVKSGSASELLKYKGELTPQEMTSTWNRLQWEQNITGSAAKESVGKSRVNKAIEKIGDITDDAQTVIKGYNTVANVINAFKTDTLLPKIDTNITNGNRKDVENWRETNKNKNKTFDINEVWKNRNKMSTADLQDASKRMAAESVIKKAMDNTKKEADDAAKEQGKKEYDAYNAEWDSRVNNPRSNDRSDTAYRMKGDGSSRAQSSNTIIDAEWRDVTPSDVSESTRAKGETYIAGLLEEKNK